jgi:hypothetical protein
MVGPFQAQGAAESDASVRLRVRSRVPGMRRDRAQAEEAGNKEAELSIKLLPQESAYGPSSQGGRPMNRNFATARAVRTQTARDLRAGRRHDILP